MLARTDTHPRGPPAQSTERESESLSYPSNLGTKGFLGSTPLSIPSATKGGGGARGLERPVCESACWRGEGLVGSVEGSSSRHPDFNRPHQGSFLILWRSLLSQMRTVQRPVRPRRHKCFKQQVFVASPGDHGLQLQPPALRVIDSDSRRSPSSSLRPPEPLACQFRPRRNLPFSLGAISKFLGILASAYQAES